MQPYDSEALTLFVALLSSFKSSCINNWQLRFGSLTFLELKRGTQLNYVYELRPLFCSDQESPLNTELVLTNNRQCAGIPTTNRVK